MSPFTSPFIHGILDDQDSAFSNHLSRIKIRPSFHRRTAILTALSRKGYWHLARTLATQTGMTNKWLARQGLVSIRERWIRIHYPATAR